MPETPKTLIDAVSYYSDLSLCEKKMASMKWPDGKITCPKCGGHKIGRLESRRLFQCRECRKQFSVKVGTIFEDSPLPLSVWFVAVWSIANCKNGISSCELARALGITQKSAWFVLHRIREAMKSGIFKQLTGTVESDETFLGGEAKNMHAWRRAKRISGRGPIGKQPIQGIIQRGGDVHTFAVPNVEGESLRANVARHVAWGSKVFTDAATGYSGLARRFAHSTVDHVREWVRGEVHTNSIENFWSLLKRSLKGTWTHIAPFHAARYCEEQAWRFNNRRLNDGSRFEAVLATTVGRRITYRQLCVIEDAGFMGKP